MNGVRWIESDSSTRRFAAQVLLSTAVLSLLFAAGVVDFADLGQQPESRADWWPLWLPLATMSAAGLAYWLLRRFAAYRIGTDGHVCT